jgi:negative regulator of flagellin synthesis FlgM
MKIEGSTPNLESVAAQRADRITSDRAKQSYGSGTTQGTDQVQVSDSATLAASAMKAAGETPDIRKDVVEQMRAKLAAGEIGADAERLADRMIDHMLES